MPRFRNMFRSTLVFWTALGSSDFMDILVFRAVTVNCTPGVYLDYPSDRNRILRARRKGLFLEPALAHLRIIH